MDEDLIRRSQAGDAAAFAALFHQYKNLVYRTSFLMLGDAGDAEDALQEVFVQVYRGLAAFDPRKAAFTTWLHRITVNHCLNRRRTRRIVALPFDGIEPLAAHGPSLEDALGEDEALHAALALLSDKLRAVVVLRYGRDLSYQEIADVLDIPVGTVKSRMDLALKNLRGLLDPAANLRAPTPRALSPKGATYDV